MHAENPRSSGVSRAWDAQAFTGKEAAGKGRGGPDNSEGTTCAVPVGVSAALVLVRCASWLRHSFVGSPCAMVGAFRRQPRAPVRLRSRYRPLPSNTLRWPTEGLFSASRAAAVNFTRPTPRNRRYPLSYPHGGHRSNSWEAVKVGVFRGRAFRNPSNGARGRSRTDTLLTAADFPATSAFAALRADRP